MDACHNDTHTLENVIFTQFQYKSTVFLIKIKI